MIKLPYDHLRGPMLLLPYRPVYSLRPVAAPAAQRLLAVHLGAQSELVLWRLQRIIIAQHKADFLLTPRVRANGGADLHDAISAYEQALGLASSIGDA
jgi:hypothetical protein